jgi:hypothetical protein
MLKEHWAYVWGAAKKGVVDCSGAFVYALAQYGLSIYHGSNTIWRRHLTVKGKIGAIDLVPGMAVFKWRKDGEPAQFINDGQDDFYHIGLYAGDGRVLEARGTKAGFVESKITDGWAYAGRIKGIVYDGQQSGQEGSTKPMQTGSIVTGIGTVNMRQKPDSAAKLAQKNPRIPEGAQVEILGEENGYTNVRYNGETGWVASQYITAGAPAAPDTEEPSAPPDAVTLTLDRATAKALYEAVKGLF